jgi:hypothetical protein
MLLSSLLSVLAVFGSPFASPPIVAQQTASAKSQPGPDAAEEPWAKDVERRRRELVRQNGPGTDASLRDRLIAMAQEDQAAPERGLTKVAPQDREKYEAAANRADTDAKLTAQLKEIIANEGWPTIAMVGIDASNGAMRILIHTRDHVWQRSLLPQLESLADAGKIDGSSVATLIDKELVSEGKLQRYGTQFKLVDGEMAMFGVEDPATLDARRAKAFLPPEEVYKQMLSQMYHLKTSDKIVMATGPAQ